MYKTLSSTSYTGKAMKNEDDILMMYNILRDLGYTGRGDRQSNRKTFLTIRLPRFFYVIQNRTFDEITDDCDDLQAVGIENFITPSNKSDIYTRLEILLELKLSGHINTLTEASNLIDQLYRIGQKQNEQQY